MYIKPPRGDIQLNDLMECVTTRFHYFLYRFRLQELEDKASLKFEYLTLGTALDRVGHFTLRLLAAHSDELRGFIASSEASFIVERLEFSSPRQIIQFLNTTLRHLDEANNSTVDSVVWRKEIFEIFSIMKCAFKCSHMNGFSHDEKCSQYVFKVPFHLSLKMVAKRELLLEKGYVLVPCGKWKSFLSCFFEAFYMNEILKMRFGQGVKESTTDERLIELKNIVTKLFNSISPQSWSNESARLRSEEMKELQKLFPPCMAYLYDNLKTNHRLSHSARFNFSLFLKDIGMSLNESIEFWRNEYSKPSKCGKCLHSWQKDSAKYTYSIRHLYGLEGRRANYCAPLCSKIQSNNLGPVQEGGCPFVNFDANRLQKYLDPDIIQKKEQIEMIMYLKTNDPTKACDYYRKALSKAAKVEHNGIKFVHKSPVEYFNYMRKDVLENCNKSLNKQLID